MLGSRLRRERQWLTRRRLCAAALASPACITRTGNAASRSITFAGFGGWFEETFDKRILDVFRAVHPDISVFYYPVGNSSQALALLRDQRALPETDVMLMEPGPAARAHQEDLLDPLDSRSLPVMQDLIPQATVPGLTSPAMVLDSLALGFAPGGAAVAPTAWRNLWDPSYGQRIALQTPPATAALAMTAVASARFASGDPKTALDAAVNALSRLAPRVVLWDPFPDAQTAIAGGDAGIGPCWNAGAQLVADHASGRFAAVVPADGSPCLPITVSLVKGARQPDAARTLIAWLLGPEAQLLLVETMYYGPVNARLSVPSAALARAGATPAMTTRRIAVDWIAMTAMRSEITAAWRRFNLGKH